MEETVNSQWALVIRDDGKASVVPLAEVPALQQDEAAIGDKTPTIIVLQAQEQEELASGTTVGPGSSEALSGSSQGTKGDREHVTDLVTVSAGREEGSVDPLAITIADASHHLAAMGPNSLENIHISVLARGDTAPAASQEVTSEPSVLTPGGSQSADPLNLAGADDPLTTTGTVGHLRLSSTKCEVRLPTLAPVCGDPRQADRCWKGKEGRKPSTQDLESKMKQDKGSTLKQKTEDFHSRVNKWSQKLAYSNELVEPFERLEATLHKDLTAELGLGCSEDVFITLLDQGLERGVRVTEASSGHIVVSGSLVELLASRDMILQEVQKLRGLPEEEESPRTREVGVMCELIPSPATTRHASTLGLDRSARRYHSVLSRPLSPEPSPLRRRPKKPMLTHSKSRNADKKHLMKSFTERAAKKRTQSQMLKNIDCAIKTENSRKNIFSRHVFPNCQKQSSQIDGTVKELKTEPNINQTIFVSDLSGAEAKGVEADSLRDLKSFVVSKSGNDLALSPGTEGDIVKPMEKPVPFLEKEVHKGTSFTESVVESDAIYLDKAQQKIEEEVEEELKLEAEPDKAVCEPVINVSEGQEEVQRTRDSDQVKFKFSCKICSYKSMRENHFLKHMQLHDKGLALYRCSECSFVSIRASHLRRHKMSHAQQVLHCHLCAYTCDDQKLLAKHDRVKHHTPKQPKPSDSVYECEECEYKTSWHYAFQRHRRTHSSSKMVVMHICQQCPYKTVRREHFLRHIKNVHQNYRPFLCDICGKAFKRQDALKQHHVSHYQSLSQGNSGQVGPYGFVCRICQKVCRSAAYLKEHMATHSEERSFLCEVCGASFKTRSVQRNHVQTIHRRPRAFTCATCDKKFNTKFALRRHMKQHDASLQEIEELPNIARSPRVSSSVGRLCELQAAPHPLPQATPSMIHLPSRSRSPLPATPLESSPQHPPSAYQITIDGQPAFLLPHIDAQHATLEDGEACISEGSSAALVSGEDGGGAELASLGDQHDRAAVSVPVGPATVHIINQETLSTGSGDLILSSEQYDAAQGSSVVASNTANYINPEHAA